MNFDFPHTNYFPICDFFLYHLLLWKMKTLNLHRISTIHPTDIFFSSLHDELIDMRIVIIG